MKSQNTRVRSGENLHVFFGIVSAHWKILLMTSSILPRNCWTYFFVLQLICEKYKNILKYVIHWRIACRCIGVYLFPERCFNYTYKARKYCFFREFLDDCIISLHTDVWQLWSFSCFLAYRMTVVPVDNLYNLTKCLEQYEKVYKPRKWQMMMMCIW